MFTNDYVQSGGLNLEEGIIRRTMPTISFRIQTFIRSKPENIFPNIADLTQHGMWSANPVQIEALTNGPVMVGSKYRSSAQVNGIHFNAELEVTQYRPPVAFSFSGKDETGHFEHHLSLSTENDGTTVERRVVFDLTPRQWLMYLLLLYPVRLPAARKALNLLKKRVEEAGK